ncbi:MAG: hypothetical protein ACP5P4_11150 [Steroidobacteraceae bacterium]
MSELKHVELTVEERRYLEWVREAQSEGVSLNADGVSLRMLSRDAVAAATTAVGQVPPELISRIARTPTEGFNLRGVFRLPVDAYADRLLPSASFKAVSAKG